MLYQLSYRLTERRARILPPTLGLCLARTMEDRYLVCLVCLVEQEKLEERNKPDQPVRQSHAGYPASPHYS